MLLGRHRDFRYLWLSSATGIVGAAITLVAVSPGFPPGSPDRAGFVGDARSQLGHASGERIGVTRNGKLAAVVVSVADLESLEAFELEQDVAAYREAKAAEDGQRVSLEDLRRELGE